MNVSSQSIGWFDYYLYSIENKIYEIVWINNDPIAGDVIYLVFSDCTSKLAEQTFPLYRVELRIEMKAKFIDRKQ